MAFAFGTLPRRTKTRTFHPGAASDENLALPLITLPGLQFGASSYKTRVAAHLREQCRKGTTRTTPHLAKSRPRGAVLTPMHQWPYSLRQRPRAWNRAARTSTGNVWRTWFGAPTAVRQANRVSAPRRARAPR